MRGVGLVLVVVACAAAGCLFRADRPSVPAIVRSLAPPQAPEGVIVESILIEQARGDRFIDRDIWANALPIGLPETRALFAENGLRVGTLTGTLPSRFHTLLESDTDTVMPQRLTFHQRKDAVVPTAGPIATAKFDVLTDVGARPKALDLGQVRCGLLVRPEVAPAGRVKVWCEPQLQHGSKQSWLRPNEDGTQFTKFEEVPLERFATLGFEVTLGPQEYLIVGWPTEQTGTLGELMFAVDSLDRPRQRLLVIRCHQANPQSGRDLPPITGSLKKPSVAAITAGRK